MLGRHPSPQLHDAWSLEVVLVPSCAANGATPSVLVGVRFLLGMPIAILPTRKHVTAQQCWQMFSMQETATATWHVAHVRTR